MKKITGMGFGLLISAAASAGCPDFNGNYKAEDTMGRPIQMQVIQKGCSEMKIDSFYDQQTLVTRTLIFDGVERVVFSSSEMSTSEKDTIDEKGITYEAVDEYIREKAKYLSHGKIFFDEQKHLVEKVGVTRADGTPITEFLTVYTRQ